MLKKSAKQALFCYNTYIMLGIFTGVLANAALVIAGSLVGLIFKKVNALKRIGERIFQAFAIFVAVMGIKGIDFSHPLYYLICLIIGIIIGEALDIDKQFNRLGNYLQTKFAKDEESTFSKGFVEASLLFCIGSMTFLGALESGIEGEHTIYITKGILDCVSSVTLSMVYGIGVAFSAIAVIVYQGLLTIGASALAPVLTDETVAMCTSVGSLSLVFIGLNMLKITHMKVANLLPAMFIPMIWQAISLMIAR